VAERSASGETMTCPCGMAKSPAAKAMPDDRAQQMAIKIALESELLIFLGIGIICLVSGVNHG